MQRRTRSNDKPLGQKGDGLFGRKAYEADLKRRPAYPDGNPRKSWDQLDELAKWSWYRRPIDKA